MSLQKVTYSFLPTAISNCALWLDGTDPAGTGVVPSAGSLSTWTDKSGKSNSPTSSSGTYPTYSPTSKCVTWNGGGAQLTFPTSLYPFVVGTAFTVFFVEQRTTGSENFIIRGSTQGTNQNLLIGHGGPSPATSWRFAFYGNDLDFTGLPTYASGEPATVSCFMYSKPNRTIYHNGGVSASVSDANASDLASWSGAMIGGNSIWPAYYGNVFEMIIYSTSLTLAQRQQVEGYLAQKYSLTGSLPVGHPGLGPTTYRADYRKNNIMRAIPYYTQFSPKQIAGCSHWFDATDSSTITLSSGSLTQWNDKSGNGRNLTAVAGFANATVSSRYQNGLNVFNFFGNGLYRTAGGNVSYPLEVYIIVALKSLTAHVDVLGMGDTSVDNFNSLTFAESAASKWHNGSSGGGRQTISLTTETSLSFLLIQWSIANGNYLLRRNGTELIQASRNYSFNNSATAIFQIGYRHTDNVYGTGANFSGYIGEIVVFNNQIGTTDRQNVESYLTQKWGLTASLPGGHQHFTKQTGAITPTALSKFRMVGVPRIIFTATGGTIVTSGFKYHLFTSSSNFVVSSDSKTVNYLVVGGGGGGGDRHGGGGGGGGVLTGTWTASVGTYTVTVGLGGVAGYYETNNSSPQGAGIKGGNSSLSGTGVSVTANGGGGGGTYDGNPTGTVGSGGGGGGNGFAGVAGTAGQGNAGGSGLQPGGGGGGGAGGVGTNANTGTGGIGTTSYSTQLLAVGYGTSFAVPTSPNVVISGGVAYIAAGGGGAASGGPGPGGSGGLGGGGRGDWNASFIQAGTANTGGGGGGSRSESEPSNGRDGGSGLVLLWYTV